MKRIGLTGGIGSGKSLVAGIWATLGIPVYHSDVRAKHLMQHDPEVRQKITDLFGSAAWQDTGELNRQWIASQVFDDRALLDKLNAIVHPAVFADLENWMNAPERQKAPFILQESAILFEENLAGRFDGIILVVAPEEIRIQRVMERDGVSRQHVLDRMQHQWPDEKKIPLSDYVIYNDGERSLIRQILDIRMMIGVKKQP